MLTFYLPSGGDKLETEMGKEKKRHEDSEPHPPPASSASRNTNTKQAYTKTFERLI